MRKRIVIDATPLLYGAKGGIGRTTKKLIDTLMTITCEYDFMLFGRRLQGQRLKDLGYRVQIVNLRLPRCSEWLIKKTQLIESKCSGDLYHATDFYMPLKKAKTIIATIHDLIFMIQPEQMVDDRRLNRWVPAFARQCDRIIAVSENTRRDIIELLGISPERIDVIYWGVDREVFFPEVDGDKLQQRLSRLFGFNRPYFLAVSCSTGRKNTPFLLDTYEKLLRGDPQNDLVLLWNPSEEIREKYSSPQYKGRFHFIGLQTDETLRALYCGASALIFPSLYEGFGLPILEAMACGTPVIASNVTSMPEVGGNAVVYINPRDENSLLKAMELFENKDSLTQGLSQKGFEQIKKFSWERCAYQTLEAYRECLQG